MFKGTWWLYLRSITLALRVMLFEHYTRAIAVIWWGAAVLSAVLLGMLHWSAALACMVIGLALYHPFASWMMRQRRYLLRRGDRVEYASASDALAPGFSYGTLVYGMRPEEMAKTSLFNKDELFFYDYFYLLRVSQKNIAIPYEWIITIEIDDQIESLADKSV